MNGFDDRAGRGGPERDERDDRDDRDEREDGDDRVRRDQRRAAREAGEAWDDAAAPGDVAAPAGVAARGDAAAADAGQARNDGEERGIALLRSTIDEVVATLPAAGSGRVRAPARGWRAAQAAIVLVVTLLAIGFWLAVRVNAPPGAEVAGVEVVVLKLDGRESAARVIDARAAGTVLIVPEEAAR